MRLARLAGLSYDRRMADGFTLQIDDEMARKIERAAAAAGMSREDYARFLLDQHTFNYDDYRWLNGDPRAERGPIAVNEPTRPWEEVRDDALKLLEEKLRGRE